MPKKSAAARNAAQRNKPKAQKSFELVRPTVEETEETEQSPEVAPVKVATATVAATPVTGTATKEEVAVSTAAKGSASARLAARRQATQRAQRSAVSLVTAEHFAYVRKDLITIAVLAAIMFAAIIFLYFMYGSVL